jgi:hypothetical protein
MNVATFEGIIENGQVVLPPHVSLPEKAKVYVVVPDVEVKPVFHIRSPRLAHREQVADFEKTVVVRPEEEQER